MTMRLILVTAALGLSFACATTTAASAPTAQGACAPATVNLGATLYALPDSSSAPVVLFRERTQVCAQSEVVGFGFRHVKLSDGKEGYVADTDLNT
jgi:hypothetical protein